MLARGLRAAAAATLRRGLLGVRGLSAASVNPLGVAVPTAPKPPLDDSVRRAVAHYRNLPVSPKKLRVVANLTPKLYWREAMMQLEFCRKNMAVMVKNCIESAVGNAEYQGMAKDRLIVDEIIVNKGKYYKKMDYKAKGKTGVRRSYFSHLRVVVKEVPEREVKATKGFARWRPDSKLSQLLAMPWTERIKELPRYKPIPGYDPYG